MNIMDFFLDSMTVIPTKLDDSKISKIQNLCNNIQEKVLIHDDGIEKEKYMKELKKILGNTNIAIVWEDMFVAANQEYTKGLVFYSEYNQQYLNDLEVIQKEYGKKGKHGSFFYSFFLPSQKVRRIQILKNNGFEELSMDEFKKFKDKFNKTFTSNFKIIIHVTDNGIEFIGTRNKIKQKVILNDTMEPVRINGIEGSIKKYFKQKHSALYVLTSKKNSNIVDSSNDKKNTDFSFYNINRLPSGIMLTPLPLILIRISFEDKSYIYAGYDVKKELITETFYPKNTDMINFVKMQNFQTESLNIYPLYEPTETINITTKIQDIVEKQENLTIVYRHACEKVENSCRRYLLSKFIDGYKIKILIKDFDTIIYKENDFRSEDDYEEIKERNRALKIKRNRAITISPYKSDIQLQLKKAILPNADTEKLLKKLEALKKPVFIEDFLDDM